MSLIFFVEQGEKCDARIQFSTTDIFHSSPHSIHIVGTKSHPLPLKNAHQLI